MYFEDVYAWRAKRLEELASTCNCFAGNCDSEFHNEPYNVLPQCAATMMLPEILLSLAGVSPLECAASAATLNADVYRRALAGSAVSARMMCIHLKNVLNIIQNIIHNAIHNTLVHILRIAAAVGRRN